MDELLVRKYPFLREMHFLRNAVFADVKKPLA